MGFKTVYGITRKDVIAKIVENHTYDSDTYQSDVVAHSVRDWNHVYLAVRKTDKRTWKTEVTAVVALLNFRMVGRHFAGSATVKYVPESNGPLYYNPPKKVLRKLSPAPNTHSAAWREICWKKYDKHVRDDTQTSLI